MRAQTILAVAALAIAAVAFVVTWATRPPAATGAERSAVLKLVVEEQHCGGADLPPHDGSPGDIAMCRGRVHRAPGGIEGGAAWFCPYIGTERAGSLCSVVASLRDGDLHLAGRLNHLSPRSTFAVTGGTGRYGSARGTAALRQIDDRHTAVTIRLSR